MDASYLKKEEIPYKIMRCFDTYEGICLLQDDECTWMQSKCCQMALSLLYAKCTIPIFRLTETSMSVETFHHFPCALLYVLYLKTSSVFVIYCYYFYSSPPLIVFKCVRHHSRDHLICL